MLKKAAYGLAGALLVVVGLAGCGSSSSPGGSSENSTAAPSKGGSISVAVYSEIKGFDPAIVDAGSNGEDRAAAIFDTLMSDDADGEAQPELAQSMTTPDGGHTWIIKLRAGVKFTDGTPLDANAVKFNLERQIAPDSQSTAKGFLSGVKSIEVVDARTVKIDLSDAENSFPQLFTQTSTAGLIGSPTAIKKDPSGFNQHPIGAGPFMLKSWVPGNKIVVVRNPHYWNAGKPYLDSITFVLIPDPQSRADALLSGQVVVAPLLPASSLSQITSNSNLKVLAKGSPGIMGITFNEQRAPGNDARIRRAVSLAFDPKQTNAVFFGGSDVWDANTDCLPFAATSPACRNGDATTPDLAKAKQLVQQYVADGRPATLELIANDQYPTEMQYVQQTLNSIGLTTKLVQSQVADWVTKISEGDYQSTMIVALPFTSFYPSVYYLLSQNGRNYPKQKNGEFEAAMSQGVNGKTASDRNAGLQRMQQIIGKDDIATWISPFTNFWVEDTSKVNLGASPEGIRFEWADASSK